MKREKEFYKKRGLPYPKANLQEKDGGDKVGVASSGANGSSPQAEDPNNDFHRQDEQVNIVLEPVKRKGTQMEGIKRKYIRCSAYTTVTHIKKFVSMKLKGSFDEYKDVSVASLAISAITTRIVRSTSSATTSRSARTTR